MSASVVDVHGLTFRYPGATQPVLDGIDLAVARGETVAVLGPSGRGKSTLLYLLGLFLRPTSGQVILHDLDVARLDDRDRSRLRAHHIGFVFQDPTLHPGWTVEENVAEGAIYAGESFPSALRRARGLLDVYRLSHISGHRPAEISGGEAQRAALCRALMRRPSLILADEPTGNLDPDNAAHVMAGLRAAADDGAAVLVVTHAASVADASDRAIRLA